jgi:hypothetical protein
MRRARLAAIQQEVKTSFLHNYGDCNCSTCWLLGELHETRREALEEAACLAEAWGGSQDRIAPAIRVLALERGAEQREVKRGTT